MIERHLFAKSLFVLLIALSLAGCPRVAYIELYNNTTSVFLLNSDGENHIIKPTQSVRVILGWSLQIESELGSWSYERAVPHGGYDGPYFDGTLRVQVNADGAMYVLKAGERPPVSGFSGQPIGYPIRPTHE